MVLERSPGSFLKFHEVDHAARKPEICQHFPHCPAVRGPDMTIDAFSEARPAE